MSRGGKQLIIVSCPTTSAILFIALIVSYLIEDYLSLKLERSSVIIVLLCGLISLPTDSKTSAVTDINPLIKDLLDSLNFNLN